MLFYRFRGPLASFCLHMAVLALLFWMGPALAPRVIDPATPVVRDATRLIAPLLRRAVDHLAGGGQQDLRPATQGQVRYTMRKVYVLPQTRLVNNPPKLIIDEGLNIDIPANPARISLGDPFSSLPGPGGPGGGRNGLGSQQGGGGVGPETGTGIATTSFGRITTAPVLIHKTEPEYSDEARKVKYQGTVIVAIEIDERGEVRRAQVVRGIGLGLDERALGAVLKWRFRPALRDGTPVSAPARVEVSFHLL